MSSNTFSEQMIDRLCKINDTIYGVIGNSLEKFDMKIILRVIDDELFM